jgi:hypothetical protein
MGSGVQRGCAAALQGGEGACQVTGLLLVTPVAVVVAGASQAGGVVCNPTNQSAVLTRPNQGKTA